MVILRFPGLLGIRGGLCRASPRERQIRQTRPPPSLRLLVHLLYLLRVGEALAALMAAPRQKQDYGLPSGRGQSSRTRRGRDRQWPCPRRSSASVCAWAPRDQGQCSTVAHSQQGPGPLAGAPFYACGLPQTQTRPRALGCWVPDRRPGRRPALHSLVSAGLASALALALADRSHSPSSLSCARSLISRLVYFYAAAPPASPRLAFSLVCFKSFIRCTPAPPSLSSSTVSLGFSFCLSHFWNVFFDLCFSLRGLLELLPHLPLASRCRLWSSIILYNASQ